MVNQKWFIWVVLLAAVYLLTACGKEDTPDPGMLPHVKNNTVQINGITYSLNENGARYYSGTYPYWGLECTNFYIECSQGSGITVEIDERLVGQTIPFVQGDTFWFFAIGNGNGIFLPLQHDTVKDGNSGWFRVERNLQTNYCTLLFELDHQMTNGKSMKFTGKIRETFVRLSKL